MGEITLNAAQREAAGVLDRNMLVAAGAGCGKTATLVERYMNILARALGEVGDIVAITFTDKAAGELKGRIHERLRKLAAASAASAGAEGERWQHHLSAVESAHISTIHGFCAEVLREFPVQAGIDPGFAVAEQLDAEELASGAVRESLFEAVTGRAACAGRLLARYAPEAVTGMLEKSLGRREEIAFVSGGFGGEAKEAAGLARALRRRAQKIAPQVAARALSSIGFEKAVCVLESNPGPAGDKLENIREAFLAAHEAWRRAGRQEYFEAIGAMAGSVGRLNWGSAKQWGDRIKDVRSALKTVRKAAADCIGLSDALEAEDWGARALEILDFLELHRLACAKYRSAKRAAGVLDYDDLLSATRDLVKGDPGTAAALAGRYRFILVDEFQDTDHVQAQIIDALASQRANLFVVGDPEQSIYRFRGAEVEVFSRLREDYQGAGQGVLKTLTGNYRALGHLLAFVNLFFGRLMPPGRESPWRSAHLPLAPQRKGGGGRVEVIMARSGESMHRARQVEAEAISRRISEIVSSGEPPVYDADEDGRETPRAAGLGDIAILFRSMSDVGIYEQQLARDGIHYHTVAGSTFYRRQELKDLVNLLRFIVDGEDTLSLVGALRSPLFAVSDDFLGSIASGGGLARYFQGREPPGGQTADHAAFARAVGLVRRLRVLRNRVPVSSILDVIFDRTGYLAAISMLFSGVQKVMNVMKLRASAGVFDAAGGRALEDFVARTSRLELAEERESEATLEGEEAAAVRLMTVHAAKGLEFPVVILADMGRRPGRFDGGAILVDRSLGMSLPTAGEDEGGWRKVIKESARSREEAEEDRVFFVAATRARDHLILSGAAHGAPRGWISKTLAALGIDSQRPGDYGFEGVTVEYSSPETYTPARAGRGGRALLSMREKLIGGAWCPGAARPETEEILARAGEVGGAFESIDSFTATEIADFSRCPLRWELVHLRGVPGDWVLEDRPETSRPPGHVVGGVLHKVLEMHRPGASLEQTLRGVLFEGSEPAAAPEALVDECLPILAALESSPFYRRISRAGGERELGFSFRLDGCLFRGTIDRYAEGEIVDFKSDEVTRQEAAGYAEHYRAQMDVYALAVERLRGRPPERVTLYFLRPQVPVTWEYGPEGLAGARRRVLGAIDRIRKGPPYPARPEKECRCEYTSLCRIIGARRSRRE